MVKDNYNLIANLKHYFGFDSFKGDQEAIIRNLLGRRRPLRQSDDRGDDGGCNGADKYGNIITFKRVYLSL